MRKRVHTIAVSVLMLAALELVWPEAPEPRVTEAVAPIQLSDVGEGSLVRVDPYSRQTGKLCPLKRTTVQAAINGELARVTVTQFFENSSRDKIEAIYVFPLPVMAAVDRMEMKVGPRFIKAIIRKREEARRIYEQARKQGHVASLLEQERPNIFTQSVTNIEPGAAIQVTLSYVETLKYDDGRYEFSFPMVVGPRYIPGAPVGRQGTGWSPDTGQVPDASRVTPKLAPPAPGTICLLRFPLRPAFQSAKSLRSPTRSPSSARRGPLESVLSRRRSSRTRIFFSSSTLAASPYRMASPRTAMRHPATAFFRSRYSRPDASRSRTSPRRN